MAVFVKVGNEYAKFSGRMDSYKLVKTATEATSYPDKMAAVAAARTAKLEKYKLVTTGKVRRR